MKNFCRFLIAVTASLLGEKFPEGEDDSSRDQGGLRPAGHADKSDSVRLRSWTKK